MLEQIELPLQYKIGNEKIDEQHTQLFIILMDMAKLIKNDAKKNEKQIEEEMNILLSSLRSYTQGHFQYEERHMEKMKYPDFEAHRTMHKSFIEKIFEIQKNALKQKKEKALVLREMASFLKDWLMNHILQEDKKYSVFEQEQTQLTKADVKMKAQSPT